MSENELGRWMEAKEMSGYELAGRLNFDQSTISLYRNGKRQVSAGFRLAFLQEFGPEEYRLAFPQDTITKFLERSE